MACARNYSVLGVALATESPRISLPGAFRPLSSAFGLEQSEHFPQISTSALFTGLSAADLTQINNSARLREFARHDLIFEQGQSVRTVFLMMSGSLKLTQVSCNGSEVILWLCGPSDAVGIFGIPTQVRHTCSAKVMQACKVLSWESSRIDLLPASLQIRRNIGRLTSYRISELEERFREIAMEKVPVRVGLALHRIGLQIGRPVVGGIEVAISREEIAQLTGTTLFSISRLISKWSDQGLTLPRRESIVIRDPALFLQAISIDKP